MKKGTLQIDMGPKEEKLTKLLQQAGRPDEGARRTCRSRWAALAHPLGGLGVLEDDLCDMAALTGSADLCIDEKYAIIFCADNGVTAEGVSQTDAAVTAVVCENLAAGRTAVCRMAEKASCRVVPVDMGILDFGPREGVTSRRIGNGTKDMVNGPAMTREEAAESILAGIDLARTYATGKSLLAAGEMGIGNTTTAAAILTVLLGRDSDAVVGRGAGLSDEGLSRKRAAVKKALEENRPDRADPLGLLAAVGGFDIGGMCGLFIGGALSRVPVLVDGIISQTAALLAAALCPAAKGAMIASHVSSEPMGREVVAALGKRPLIDAGMHLGEGTGAVAAMPLLDMALAVYRDSYTFKEGQITAYVDYGAKT